MNLVALIKEATTFGSAACLAGSHQWTTEGGRGCPKSADEQCSQAVYKCSACGEYDYGDKGGPAWRDCFVVCSAPDESQPIATSSG